MEKNNVNIFFKRLSKENPNPKSDLEYSNNFTLLLAVVLSAQSTDVGVNKATKKLFLLADNPKKILNLGLIKLKSLIKTIGLYNTKAKNIMNLSKILLNKFNGKVPNKREDLISLPGVGRKTAQRLAFYILKMLNNTFVLHQISLIYFSYPHFRLIATCLYPFLLTCLNFLQEIRGYYSQIKILIFRQL